MVLVGTLLTPGLAGLLFLHTALAEDSFRLHDLKDRSAVLADREQALEQELALEASPRRLAARAQALGMVRSENPAFIRLSDGRVLGKPKAGRRPAAAAGPAAEPRASAARRRHAGDARQPDTVRARPTPRRAGDGSVTTPRHPRRPAAPRRRPARGAARAGRAPDAPAPTSRAADPHRPPPPPRPAGPPAAGSARLRAARLRGAVVVLAFVLSLFGARLVQLQGLDAPTYAAEAEQGRLRTVDAARRPRHHHRPQRGRAGHHRGRRERHLRPDQGGRPGRDRGGAGAGAADGPHRPARRSSPVTPRFVYVAKAVTPATWRKVRALDHPDPTSTGLPGIYAEQTSKRVYPAGQVGANIVGFVGADGKGLGGIEYALDSTLAGRDGTATYELSAGGRRIPSGVDTERDAVPGTDVRLTIDRDIQYVAQKAIAKAVASSQAQSGTVIVYDPKTGDLLAVATAPTFDPNDPGAAPAEDRGDRAAERGLRARQHRQDHHCLRADPGGRDHADHADHRAEPALPRRQVVQGLRGRTASSTSPTPARIAKSSNIGTIKAAERLGNLKRLYPYLKKFGVGEPTGLGLPGEQSGEIPKPGDWSATSGYTMTLRAGLLGQHGADGRGLRDVANDGVRVSPRLVASTTGAGRHGAPDAGLEADPGRQPADRPRPSG